MSRPAIPSTTSWANGNYPAGGNPWNGQPKRAAPGTDGFTPNAVVPAEEMNYVVNRNASEAQNISTTQMTWLGQIQAMNWDHVESAIGTAHGGTAPFYVGRVRWGRMDANFSGNLQTLQGAWYGLVYDNAGTPVRKLVRSQDGGYSWTVLGTISAITLGPSARLFTVLPNGDVVVSKGGNVQVNIFRISSGTVADVTHNASIFTPLFCEPMYDFANDGAVNGAILIGNDATNTKAVTCNSDGTTWTDQSSHVPASLASGTGVNSAWVGAANSGLYVIFRVDAAQAKYVTLTSASSWTERTSPVGASESAVAVTWSETDGVFMLLTNVSGNSKIYTSPDGITWTLKATLTGITLSGLSCTGSLYVAGQNGAGSAYNQQPDGLWACTDKGVTWYRLPTYSLVHETVGDARSHDPEVTVARDENGSYQLCVFNSRNTQLGLAAGQFTQV